MKILSNIESWILLVALENTGTLSKAADVRGVELSSASRTISQMEKALGFELLDRSTKPAALTSRAKSLMPKVRELVRSFEEVEKAISRTTNVHHVRVSLPTNSNRNCYFDALEAYQRARPEVCFEHCVDIGVDGLLQGVTDVTLIGMFPREADVFYMPAVDSFTMLFATPDYLARCGRPESPADLAKHTILLRQSSSRTFTTRLENRAGDDVFLLPPSQRCLHGDPTYCKSMMLAGKGIAFDLSLNLVEDELARGDVVPVLPGWHRKPWRNAVVCRREDSLDPVIQDVMKRMVQVCTEHESALWKRWYTFFGIPISACEKTVAH